MNNVLTSIHNIEEIVAREHKLSGGTYVKKLLIKTNDGTYEITLFGDSKKNLEIRDEEEY